MRPDVTGGNPVGQPATTPLAGPSIETLEALLDVTYTWGYQETRAKLRDLYDKAVRAQWISDDVLPWKQNVDLEAPMGPEQMMPLYGSDLLANPAVEFEQKGTIALNCRIW